MDPLDVDMDRRQKKMKEEKGLIAECWHCHKYFRKEEMCSDCGFYKCPHCGGCGCQLNDREREIAKICIEACLDPIKPKSEVLRARLLDVLKGSLPLNTAQICRIINGATSKTDIDFCRPQKWKWHDSDGFKKRGAGNIYEYCSKCKVHYSRVRYHLQSLEKLGWIESRLELRTDPILRGKKDKMRMWAIQLPSLLNIEKEGSKG